MEYKYRDILEKILEAMRPLRPGFIYEHTATGNPATFKTNLERPLEEMVIPILLRQDLHGYQRPWPGGSYQNLADFVDNKGINANGSVVGADGRIATVNPIPIESGVSYVFKTFGESNIHAIISVYNGSTLVRRVSSINNGDTLDTSDGDTLYVCAYKTDSITVDSAKAMVVKSTETVTEYSPYSNTCPITGLTGCNVSRTGKNLFDNENAGWVIGKYIDANGEIKSQTGYRYTTAYTHVKSNTQYTIQLNKTSEEAYAVTVALYDGNKNFISRVSAISATTSTGVISGSFTTSSNTKYIRFNTVRYSTDVQIEEGSTASTYEAFGTVYPITFPTPPGTVYAGTVTIDKEGTVTLVVDHAIVTLTENTSYTYDETTHSYVTGNIATGINQKSYLDTFQGKCSTCLPYTQHPAPPGSDPWATIAGACFVGYTGNDDSGLRFSINGSRNDNIATILAGTEVYYELSQTRTYTLTIDTITTLKGINNIWTDTPGINTIKYWKKG